MHVGLGLNLGLGLGTGGVLKQNPADYPALMAWWKFSEGTGTTLADWLYTETGGSRGVGGSAVMTVTANGSGNAWGTAGAFSTSSTTSNQVYARTAAVAPRGAGQIGNPAGKPVIVEIDGSITPPGSSASMVFCVGRATSTTNRGFSVQRNSAGSMMFAASGGTAAFTAISWSETFVQNATGRNHWLFVFDRTGVADPGTVSLYLNGTLVSTRIPGSVAGDIIVPNSGTDGRAGLGATVAASASEFCASSQYNVRVWYPAAVPASMAIIAQEMAVNSERLPAGMQGVAS